MSAELHLTTFGIVRLEDASGRVLQLSQQQLALLSVLTVMPSATRAEVGVLLWPERTFERASHSLSQTIYATNKKCGPIIGRPNSTCIGLNKLVVQSDYDLLLRRAATAASTEVEIGTFISSLRNYPSDALDEWRDGVVANLRRLYENGQAFRPEGRVGDSLLQSTTDEPAPRTFVGRTAELAMARRTWLNSKSGVPTLVVVAGESGIGKSAFCRRVQRMIALDGGVVRMLHCSSTLGGELHRVPRGLLGADCVNEHICMSQDMAPRMLATRFIADCSAPIAVIIEDVQHIDPASAAWIEEALRQADDASIMLVVSVNTDSRADRDRMVRIAGASGGGGVWIELQPLSDDESLELVKNQERLFGVSLPDSSRDIVVRVGRGHPLFLGELAREAMLRPDPAGAAVTLHEQLYTQTIDSVLRRRVERLTHEGRLAAIAMAVLGQCTLEELAAMTDLDDRSCRHAVAELGENRLVTVDKGCFHLDHELVRIAALKALSPTDRCAFHDRAARILLARDDRQEGAVARHFHAAGQLERAYSFALAAARRSEEEGSTSEALRHVSLAEMAAVRLGERVDAVVERSRLLTLSGEFEQACSSLESVEHRITAGGHEKGRDLLEFARTVVGLEKGALSTEVAATRLRRLADSVRGYRDDRLTTHLVRYLLTAAHGSGLSPIVGWLVTEIESGSMVDSSGPSALLHIMASNAQAVYGCIESAHRLLDLAHQRGAGASTDSEVAYHTVRGIVYLVEGSLSDAREELERALRKSIGRPGQWGHERVLTNLAVVQLEMGDLDAAYASLKRALQSATNHERLAVLANQAAWCLHARRFDILVEVINDLDHANRTLCVRWVGLVSDTFRGYWYLHHGYLPRAEELAIAIAAELPASRRDITDRSYSEILIARVCVLRGRASDAVERLRQILDNVPDAQWSCRLRLQSELASIINKTYPAESRRLAAEVRAIARRNGAFGQLSRLAE